MKNKFQFIKKFPFIISVIGVIAVIIDLGFYNKPYKIEVLHTIFLVGMITGFSAILVRYLFKNTRPNLKVLPFDLVFVCFLLVLIFIDIKLIFQYNFVFLKDKNWIYSALILFFIRELSVRSFDFKRMSINPAQLFILSFLFIIVVGSIILSLPKATHTGISIIDAVFTSTSAVCVTGLIVVDTANYFTEFGQYIILILIQLGGLGIMTFTSYFSYFFKTGSSYENQLLISSMNNTEKIGEVFKTLQRIILITFIVEGVGAFFIFHSIDKALIPSIADRTFFSVFHSISSFCNAGFSTLQNNFYEPAYRFNYPLHLIIAFLIILGGIGFPIVFNLLSYIKNTIKNLYYKISGNKAHIHLYKIINVHTRIVLIITTFLLIGGTLLFFVFEYNNTLTEHNFYGKIVTAFFGSVTCRTAGFNTVDYAVLNVPTVLIMLFLMWVGASPGSTGGGIKTSTLAIAYLNFIALAKGQSKIEVFKREVAPKSVNRAFAIITLSIVAILVSIFCISLFDIDKGLLNITFECVSAFGTVGLSRGITASLSEPSKIVLIFTMFIGRVSMLTILIALFKKIAQHNYRYPSEEVLIN